MGKCWEMAIRNICFPSNDGCEVLMIADLCKGLQLTCSPSLFQGTTYDLRRSDAVKNGPSNFPFQTSVSFLNKPVKQLLKRNFKKYWKKKIICGNHISTSISISFLNGKVPNSLKFTSSLHRPIEPVPTLCHENLRACVCSLKRSGPTETNSTRFRVFLISLSKLWELIMWQVDSSTIPIFSLNYISTPLVKQT